MDRSVELAQKYVAENIQPYLASPVPIDPSFITDVESFLTGWVAGKALDAAYDYLKKRLESAAYRAHLQRSHRILTEMIGSGPEVTALNVGRLRPFLAVGPGHVVWLQNLSILCEGSPDGLFAAADAPGVILSNVKIVEANSEEGRRIKETADAAARKPLKR